MWYFLLMKSTAKQLDSRFKQWCLFVALRFICGQCPQGHTGSDVRRFSNPALLRLRASIFRARPQNYRLKGQFQTSGSVNQHHTCCVSGHPKAHMRTVVREDWDGRGADKNHWEYVSGHTNCILGNYTCERDVFLRKDCDRALTNLWDTS